MPNVALELAHFLSFPVAHLFTVMLTIFAAGIYFHCTRLSGASRLRRVAMHPLTQALGAPALVVGSAIAGSKAAAAFLAFGEIAAAHGTAAEHFTAQFAAQQAITNVWILGEMLISVICIAMLHSEDLAIRAEWRAGVSSQIATLWGGMLAKCDCDHFEKDPFPKQRRSDAE